MFDIRNHRINNLKGKEQKDSVAGAPQFIVAGLGNPGAQYDKSRHNAGFMAVDCLARKMNAVVERKKYKGLCGDAVIAGKKVLLLKPQTFMNLSGESVKEAVDFFKVPMTRVIVLYDDISLPVGRIRVRAKGTNGGHNGIKNIIQLTGTEVFPRVKIGVGQKPHPDYDLAAWVLSRFPDSEFAALQEALDNAVKSVEEIIKNGTSSAMNLYNGNNQG